MFTRIVSAREAGTAIAEGSAAVFDCSFDLDDPAQGMRDYAEKHIPGAAYLHLDDDLSAPAGPGGRHPLPDPEILAERLRQAGLNRDRQVIAYDRTAGAFAARLWWLLRWLGHEAVAVLDGGLAAWETAGMPVERGYPASRGPGDFAPSHVGVMPVVDAGGVLTAQAGGHVVVDARSPERFTGRPHPLDPVSGHIPGARNRFFMNNLDASGRFRPPADLAEAFRKTIGAAPPDQTIMQCGSGVTACHNLLAMEIAGLPGAALYPGSWSEWILDPSRPVSKSRSEN